MTTVEHAEGPVQEAGRLHAAWLGQPRGDLGSLLTYLREEIPFYRGAAVRALTDLPVVDRALHRSRARDFRPAGPPAPYELATSGSTGEPLTVRLDAADWYGVNYHFFTQVSRLAGLGADAFTPGTVAVLFASSKPTRRSVVRPLPALHQGLYVRLQLAAPAAAVAALHDRLRAPVLYGKPTYLLDLRAILAGQGAARAPWSPRVLLCSGEPLHRDDRERLQDYFDAPLVDALASTEGGLIAATLPDGDAYEVLSSNACLEVLTEDGSVRDQGEGELVLTNLAYRGTAFARYRTGDRAELCTPASGPQRLVRLWGREPRSVRFRTRRVPTDVLTERLGLLPGMGDFQTVTGPGGRPVLRVMPDVGCTDRAALLAGVRAAVRRLLPDEDVAVEPCDRITPRGGKKRRFR